MTLTTCLFRLTIFVVQHHFKRYFYDINIICMYDSCYNWGKQVYVYVVIHLCDGLCFSLSGSKSVKVIYIYIRLKIKPNSVRIRF
jgi:hypothetical protein